MACIAATPIGSCEGYSCWDVCAQGGPSPAALQDIWRFLLALHTAAPQAGWDAVGRWPLIPSTTAGGTLVRIAARALVFCPPEPDLAAPDHDAAQPETPASVAETAAGVPEPAAAAEASMPQEAAADEEEDVADEAASSNETRPLLSASATAAESAGADSMHAARGDAAGEQHDMPRSPEAAAGVSAEQQEPWCWLRLLLERLALPVLDARLGPQLRVVCLPDGQERLSTQDLLLRKLHLCCQAGLFQVREKPLQDRLLPLASSPMLALHCIIGGEECHDSGQHASLPMVQLIEQWFMLRCRWTRSGSRSARSSLPTSCAMCRARPLQQRQQQRTPPSCAPCPSSPPCCLAAACPWTPQSRPRPSARRKFLVRLQAPLLSCRSPCRCAPLCALHCLHA